MTRLEIIAALEAAREKALTAGPATTGERLRDLASAVKAAAYALARCGETIVPAPSEPEIAAGFASAVEGYKADVTLLSAGVLPDEIDEDPPGPGKYSGLVSAPEDLLDARQRGYDEGYSDGAYTMLQQASDDEQGPAEG